MKKLVTLCCILFAANTFAQNVGVNVAAPTENLHVDSTIKIGKNSSIGASTPGRKNLLKFGDANYVTIGEEVADDKLYIRYGDLIFLKSATNANGSGYIGVNTETPSAQMDINGTLRIRGNGAAAGNVLTSDANGNATWQAPGGSNIYSVGSVDFKSATGSSPAVTLYGGSGGAYYSAAYYGNMVAPVHLPDGAKVYKIVVWYLDNDASENISFSFNGEVTTTNYSGGYSDFATMSSSGNVSNSFRTVTQNISTPVVIDNESNSYQFSAFVHWSGSFNSFAVKSVKFYYTL